MLQGRLHTCRARHLADERNAARPCVSVKALEATCEQWFNGGHRYMRKPVTINIGSAGKATDNVTQHIIMAKDNDKPRLLEDWINEAPAPTSPASSKRLVLYTASETCVLGSLASGSLWQRLTSKHAS